MKVKVCFLQLVDTVFARPLYKYSLGRFLNIFFGIYFGTFLIGGHMCVEINVLSHWALLRRHLTAAKQRSTQ